MQYIRVMATYSLHPRHCKPIFHLSRHCEPITVGVAISGSPRSLLLSRDDGNRIVFSRDYENAHAPYLCLNKISYMHQKRNTNISVNE